jgi:hypothetical protein
MAKITVTIEKGKVKDVDGIPVDMYLEVRNYDVENLVDSFLSKDDNGKPCQVLEWRAPE